MNSSVTASVHAHSAGRLDVPRDMPASSRKGSSRKYEPSKLKRAKKLYSTDGTSCACTCTKTQRVRCSRPRKLRAVFCIADFGPTLPVHGVAKRSEGLCYLLSIIKYSSVISFQPFTKYADSAGPTHFVRCCTHSHVVCSEYRKNTTTKQSKHYVRSVRVCFIRARARALQSNIPVSHVQLD